MLPVSFNILCFSILSNCYDLTMIKIIKFKYFAIFAYWNLHGVAAAAFIQIKRALKLYTCWKATQKSEQCLYSLYITVKLQTNIQNG